MGGLFSLSGPHPRRAAGTRGVRRASRGVTGAQARRAGWSGLGAALGRFAPGLVEPVELARVGREDVDDHVEVVHEDPAGFLQALDATGQEAVVLLHVLVDAVVDRLGLAIGA